MTVVAGIAIAITILGLITGNGFDNDGAYAKFASQLSDARHEIRNLEGLTCGWAGHGSAIAVERNHRSGVVDLITVWVAVPVLRHP
jgi:hypothetical protein